MNFRNFIKKKLLFMDAHDFVSEKFDKIVRNSIDSVESS